MIEFLISTPENYKDFARIALENNLYVPIETYALKKKLEDIQKTKRKTEKNKRIFESFQKNENSSFIILLKKDEKYIGICAFFLNEKCTIQTFIKEDERRKGYAFQMAKLVMEHVPDDLKSEIVFLKGELQSLFFFSKLINENLISENNLLHRSYVSLKIKYFTKIKNLIETNQSITKQDMKMFVVVLLESELFYFKNLMEEKKYKYKKEFEFKLKEELEKHKI